MDRIPPQYLVDAEGKPQNVLLKVAEFEELLECAQEVLDPQEIETLREEPTIPWEQVKADREATNK